MNHGESISGRNLLHCAKSVEGSPRRGKLCRVHVYIKSSTLAHRKEHQTSQKGSACAKHQRSAAQAGQSFRSPACWLSQNPQPEAVEAEKNAAPERRVGQLEGPSDDSILYGYKHINIHTHKIASAWLYAYEIHSGKDFTALHHRASTRSGPQQLLTKEPLNFFVSRNEVLGPRL